LLRCDFSMGHWIKCHHRNKVEIAAASARLALRHAFLRRSETASAIDEVRSGGQLHISQNDRAFISVWARRRRLMSWRFAGLRQLDTLKDVKVNH